MKNTTTQRWETSALESTSMSNEQISEAAQTMFGGSLPKGVVKFKASLLASFDLRFEKDGISHSEHGNILGWPALEGEISNIASDLADAVTADGDTDVSIY